MKLNTVFKLLGVGITHCSKNEYFCAALLQGSI